MKKLFTEEMFCAALTFSASPLALSFALGPIGSFLHIPSLVFASILMFFASLIAICLTVFVAAIKVGINSLKKNKGR